jgi:hypothetical protein
MLQRCLAVVLFTGDFSFFKHTPHGVAKASDACVATRLRERRGCRRRGGGIPLFQPTLNLWPRLLSLSMISTGESLSVNVSFSRSQAAPL